MRTLLTVAVALALAASGCVTTGPSGSFDANDPEPAPTTPAPTTEPATSPTPGPSPDPDDSEDDPPAEEQPPFTLDYGIVGGNATTANQTTYYVNASLAVPVTIELDGAEIAAQTVEGNQTWTLPLTLGQTPFEASIATPDGTVTDARVLVRLAATTLIVDYCHYHPDSPTDKRDEYTAWIDVDARPSIDYYTDRPRPDTFTAHDQLEAWGNATGIVVEYSYFDGFGYAVDSIDDVGNPVSSSAPPYWLYRVNGEDAQEGISTQAIVAGDVVEWRASNLSAPCE